MVGRRDKVASLCGVMSNVYLRKLGNGEFEMINMIQSILTDVRKDTDGASLAEYALLLGLITGAIVLTVAGLSGAIGGVIDATSALISGT